MGKILFIVLAIFLLLGAFSDSILGGIKRWRTEDTTQSFSVTTGAAETTANVTLTNELFQDNVTQVISVTSNISGEAPVATSYSETTQNLLLSALTVGATHTLVVNYYAESTNTAMQAIGPWLGLLIIGGLIVAIIYKGHKGR